MIPATMTANTAPAATIRDMSSLLSVTRAPQISALRIILQPGAHFP